MSSHIGKYDVECRLVQATTHAKAIVVIVLNGNRGNGFSIAIDGSQANPFEFLEAVPNLLRDIAKKIEEENTVRKGSPS